MRKLSALDQRLMTPDKKRKNNNRWRTGGGGCEIKSRSSGNKMVGGGVKGWGWRPKKNKKRNNKKTKQTPKKTAPRAMQLWMSCVLHDVSAERCTSPIYTVALNNTRARCCLQGRVTFFCPRGWKCNTIHTQRLLPNSEKTLYYWHAEHTIL